MKPTPLDVLGATDYMLLTTFRKDGTPVPTPVWVVRVGDELRVWSAPDVGKIKRIRCSGKVQLAPCSVRGVARGRLIDAVARLMPDSEMGPVLGALTAKYGALGWLTTIGVRLGIRPGAVISITVS